MVRIGRRSFIKGASGVAMAGAVSALDSPSFADTWPSKSVRIIVPLAAGGGLDYVARQWVQVLSPILGQQFFVENHTGAGGSVGMDLAMKSEPDGYTILITNDNAASAPHILRLTYDYTKVLVPIIDLAHQPLVLAVHPSLGVNSVAEFVDYVKRNPGLGFASSGVGSNQHVLGLWFAREAGVRLEHVPYRGAGAAVGDFLGGHVRAAFLGPTALINQHRAGAIKILAQSSAQRLQTLPDIPTLAESGYKSLILDTWYGAFAPPGTDAQLVTTINAGFAKALDDNALREGLTKSSMEAKGGAPDLLGELARADSVKYERLIRELGIAAG
jgi:tripartite-type tricarboxylate transporter receptor subunit TctC